MGLYCSIFRRTLKEFTKMYITCMMSLACSTIHTRNPEEHQALVLQHKRTSLMPNRHRNGFTAEELTWEWLNPGMEIFSFQKMVGTVQHSTADWAHEFPGYVTSQEKWTRSHPAVLMTVWKSWEGCSVTRWEGSLEFPFSSHRSDDSGV